MTVEELIEELQTHPSDIEVRIAALGEVSGVIEGLYFEDDDFVTPALDYEGEDAYEAEPCLILEI